MRQHLSFDCGGDTIIGTLDIGNGTENGTGKTGLLIVSGGNEIRCGAYAGQAAMAATFAAYGYPVFRYDRRGIGDSEGENSGFESSHDDIAAALSAFRAAAPDVTRVVAFGNCDAASALVLFHSALGLDTLVLANPWVIETANNDAADDTSKTFKTSKTSEAYEASGTPNAAAIRARYWARIKNPRSMIDLITGKIDLRKLAGGLVKAVVMQPPSGLATQIAAALANTQINTKILIAKRDTTAQAFISAWYDYAFTVVRNNANITLHSIDSPSHSFADSAAKAWLTDQILASLG